MRAFAGLIAGVLAGIAAMTAIALIGGQFFPIQVDPAIEDPVRQTAAAFPAAPTGARIFVALAWLGGGFVGALVARWIGRRIWPAWAAAGVVALLAVANIFFLPLPAWMQVATVVMPLLGALFANHVPLGRPAASSPEAPADG